MSEAIFLFHRDLRTADNIGLIETCRKYDIVYPVFIFTPDQITNNSYKSDRAVQFMINSLKEIDLPISFYYGDTLKVLKKINIPVVCFNRDFTPYALHRDNLIKKNFQVDEYDDVLLNPPENVLKADGYPYMKFTPFYKNAKKIKINKPIKFAFHHKCKSLKGKVDFNKFYKKTPSLLTGGRKEAMKLLARIPNNYTTTKDFPSKRTTNLSAHLKFGTISVREAYWKFYGDLRKQLYWRDFYMNMLYHFPNLNGSYTRNFKFNWKRRGLDEWKQGKTGVPIVDAGMREMNATGFMHNRARMIVATYLIFNLNINWKEGETYFSQTLTDIDLASNLGNWKWIAGIETYSNDFYKTMNVITQTKRFDPDCTYIKKWCPEYKNMTPKEIFQISPIDIKQTRLDFLEQFKK